MIIFYTTNNQFPNYLVDHSQNQDLYQVYRAESFDVTNSTIIDRWNTVQVPPPPELKTVMIDPQSTALLILDMEDTICKVPRCVAIISNINNLLTKARQSKMLVVYSLIPSGDISDITVQLAPLPTEPIVKSSVDKFYNTALERILKSKAIKTVIVTGYASNGAVLHTATAAAFRGYNVIVPLDCISAINPYAEQYTAWHMVYSPGTRKNTTLTKTSLMNFQS